jgi:hypothetical protein
MLAEDLARKGVFPGMTYRDWLVAQVLPKVIQVYHRSSGVDFADVTVTLVDKVIARMVQDHPQTKK